MTKRKALHRLIRGFDAYKSCGLPPCVWNLMIDLTREVYGDKGVALIEPWKKKHEEYGDVYIYSIDGWYNDNERVTPASIIKKLKGLTK